MKNYKLIVTTLILAAFSSCVNSDDYGVPNLSDECVTIAKTKEVSDITNIATATAVPYTTSETVVDYIEAYVTSSDEGGNFYKSISMMSLDGLKGFSMPVDNYNLYTEFEPGRKVTIKLDKNRFFNKQHGSTVIGSSYNNGVGRISGVEYKNVILRSCVDVEENTIVKNLSITQAKNDQYLNMLIEFDAVQFTDASLGKKYYDASLNSLGGATNHEISDQFGNKVILRVSEFATFAANTIPSKNGKIRGVMTKYNSDYQFMIRTINDVDLTGDRLAIDLYPPLGGTAITFDATINEPFTSYTSTNQQVFPKYINDAAIGGKYWQVKTFSSNKYIQMSSFGGTPEANRTLFIVPVNMTSANTLSFKTKDGYNNGNVLKVYYTTNYVPGSQITTATLVDITSNFTIASGSTSGYATNFTNSGTYNIPAGVTGNGFFVFEYVGNGSGTTTTMQIDDIVIN
ncbi:MAG: choice-of-anchor J domain-containing protein [Flavobacterium sp.]|nr:choice-of-anchor J domain-containing protein [Flavobacterium sp.]MBP6073588.1 choice-of-anchor J domain-containing protein [Flavobacterium sp.]